MSGVRPQDTEGHEGGFSSVVWNSLDREERHGGVVTRLSCAIDKIPGLLVLERCRIGMPAVSALVRLRMQHARFGGVANVIQLDDASTPIGVFARRVFLLAPPRRRLVIAAAAEIDNGQDAVFQFVTPSVSQDAEKLEALSSLAMSKVLELCERS